MERNLPSKCKVYKEIDQYELNNLIFYTYENFVCVL